MAINYKNYPTANVGVTATTVYAPTTTGIQSTVIGLTLANSQTSPVSASVTLTSGGVTVYIIKNVVIPVGNALNIVDAGRFVVEQNDYIQVQSSIANSVDVLVSTIEIV